MTSHSPTSEREEQRRLDVRTLAIASAGSATAALATSRLWFAGTWIAAALTPVIVAFVSELLHRPAQRISRVRTTHRVATPERPASPPDRAQPMPSRAPDSAPMTVYRSESRATTPKTRRRIALGVVALTALLALAIAATVITVPELIAGQSLGHSGKATTLLGGRPRKQHSPSGASTTRQRPTTPATEPQQTTPQTETMPAPARTAPQTTATAPQTAPPASTTPTAPAP